MSCAISAVRRSRTKKATNTFVSTFVQRAAGVWSATKCDLYGDEDQESAIRSAAEAAEKAWKEKEQGRDGADDRAAQAMVDALVGRRARQQYWETWLDAIVDVVVE